MLRDGSYIVQHHRSNSVLVEFGFIVQSNHDQTSPPIPNIIKTYSWRSCWWKLSSGNLYRHVLDLTRNSCEKCNYRCLGRRTAPESHARPQIWFLPGTYSCIFCSSSWLGVINEINFHWIISINKTLQLYIIGSSEMPTQSWYLLRI
jgi:hypothetical protein